MSTCIKTGGLIVLEDYNHAFSCDLHLVRAPGRRSLAIIAYTAGQPIMREWPEHAVMLTIPREADYFSRSAQEARGYGVVVACTEVCVPSKALLEYIQADPTVGQIIWRSH